MVDLRDKKTGLIPGIANQPSIACGRERGFARARAHSCGCARAMLENGAFRAVSYLNAKAGEHRLVSIGDGGALARFLVSDQGHAITGDMACIGAGYHMVG